MEWNGWNAAFVASKIKQKVACCEGGCVIFDDIMVGSLDSRYNDSGL